MLHVCTPPRIWVVAMRMLQRVCGRAALTHVQALLSSCLSANRSDASRQQHTTQHRMSNTYKIQARVLQMAILL